MVAEADRAAVLLVGADESRSFCSRSSVVSWSSCDAHWNGVCGFGTNPPIDTVQRMSRRPETSRPVAMTFLARSAISSTSSSVSVGRPHMKYSFTCRQPWEYAAATVRIRSSSETILLITLRSRSDPPSGANVRPDRRPLRENSLASVMLKASTRVDGSDSETLRALVAVGEALGHVGDLAVVGD